MPQITIGGGANFSNAGLGNVNWAETYIAVNTSMTTPQKTALRAFYTSFVSAGFTGKFDVLRMYFNVGTNAFNKLNMLNLNLYTGTFANDVSGANTLSGYQFNSTAQRYLSSGYAISLSDLAAFHMHAYNTTTDDINGFLMGYFNTSNASNPLVALSRRDNINTNTRGSVNINGVYSVSVTGHVNNTALLGFSKSGNVQKLYDAGVMIGTATVTPAIVFPTPTIALLEGAVNAGTGTDCKVFLTAYGRSAWSDADETAFNAMVNTFKTAIGA